ncbi:MAG TPA: hypothetical protein VLF93_04280 [Candidatus Saccharimonadales bacterium]|nr:hypothetical protein [Candidatus Saccharimonadales bacterium]
MDKKKYKQEYVLLLKRLTKILAKHDLLGLVSGGSPRNEYSQESTLIVAKLQYCTSISDVDNLVADVYKKIFGEEYALKNQYTYAQAKDIFSAYKDYLDQAKNSRQ